MAHTRQYFGCILGFATASTLFFLLRVTSNLTFNGSDVILGFNYHGMQQVTAPIRVNRAAHAGTNVTHERINSTVHPIRRVTTTRLPTIVPNDEVKYMWETFGVEGPLESSNYSKVCPKDQVLSAWHRPHATRGSDNSTCMKSFRNSPVTKSWFNRKFIPNIKILLEKEDINKWDRFSKLVNCLSLPIGYRNLADRKGFIRLVNNANYSSAAVIKRSPGKCVRCAIVGTGGILRGSKLGKEIDSYDEVFRMNIARIKGFEDDVGTKTTIYSAYPESFHIQDITNIKDVYLLLPIFTNFMVSWLERFVNGTLSTFASPTGRYASNTTYISPQNVRIIHPDIIRNFHLNFLNGKGVYPSTGAIIVAAAINMCDEIKLYGFGGQVNSTHHHYYDNQLTTHSLAKSSHNFLNEWDIWIKLQDYGVVSLYLP